MARLFFENVKLIYSFFSRTKVQVLYKGKSILKVIDIRWAGHVRATNVIFENLNEIVETLTEVIENNFNLQKERSTPSNICQVTGRMGHKFNADDIALATGIT